MKYEWPDKVYRLLCLEDFKIFANENKIPLVLRKNDPGNEDGHDPYTLDLYYFQRDEYKIKQAWHFGGRACIWINHFIVPDRIGNTEKNLIEYRKGIESERR